MDYRTIQKCGDFLSLQRIKRVYHNQKSSKSCKKVDRLDRLNNLTCCNTITPAKNNCCSYSLNGESRAFTTIDENCLVLRATMCASKVKNGPWGPLLLGAAEKAVGFNKLVLTGNYDLQGKLSNNILSSSIQLESILVTNNATKDPSIAVTFSGDVWGKLPFKCLILTSDDIKIKLVFEDFIQTINPADADFKNPFYWDTQSAAGFTNYDNNGKYVTYFWELPATMTEFEQGAWNIELTK